jgi:uncharacterized protein YbjT (DUF2867 family)
MFSGLTLVHGGSGNLGSNIIKELIAFGVPATSIVAGVRNSNSEGAKAITKFGVQLRVADYSDRAGLEKAYQGVETVVFVPLPSLVHMERCIAADNSVNACVVAGVQRFVLVSFPNGRSDSVISLQPGYLFSESLVRTSLLQSWVIVRMGFWADALLDSFQVAAQTGVLSAVAKPTDPLALVSRADTARGIAAVTVKKELVSQVFELGNQVTVTLPQIAGYISEVAGKKVIFKPVTLAESAAAVSAKLPDNMKPLSYIIARVNESLFKASGLGELAPSKDFTNLVGQPPETVRDYIKRHLKFEA